MDIHLDKFNFFQLSPFTQPNNYLNKIINIYKVVLIFIFCQKLFLYLIMIKFIFKFIFQIKLIYL